MIRIHKILPGVAKKVLVHNSLTKYGCWWTIFFAMT